MFRHELTFTTHGQCNALMEVIRSGRAYLPRFGRSESFPAGHIVYDYGDAVEHLYLVEEGMVRTSVLSSGGRELVTGIWGAGDLFGQFCLCRQGVRNERATVIADAKIVRMGVEELLELAATGDGALAMLQLFCQRISVLEQQVAELAFANVRTRLGLLLLRLAREGDDQEDGSVLLHDSPTHEEMALRIGTTREQVSAILAQFRKQGVIAYQRSGPLRIYPDRLQEHIEDI